MTNKADKTPEQQAAVAIRAAKLERQIGCRMARKHAVNQKVYRLYIIARLLERGLI